MTEVPTFTQVMILFIYLDLPMVEVPTFTQVMI